MTPEKEQISARQLMFSIACYIQASALILGYLTEVTRQDSWIAILIGYFFALILLALYTALAETFPGLSLVQINIKVFGKIPGKAVSLLYVYFFFSLSFLNTRDFDDFMNGFIMPNTPAVVIGGMMLFICAWAVRKGVETMTRYSTLFVILTFATTVVICMLLLKDIQYSNFLPAFSLSKIQYIQGSHSVSIISFGEIIAFFMLFPYVKNTKKIRSSLYGGTTIGGITILLVTLRNIAVIGPLFGVLTLPTFESIRLIRIGNMLTRMEVLYAGVLITLTFFRISILFFATVSGIAQIFNLRSYRSLVPTVGVLILLFSLTSFPSAVDHAYWGAHVAAFYSSFFEVILPLITVLVLVFRIALKKI